MPEDTTIRSDDAAIFPGATIMQCEERASSSLRAGQMRFILTPPEQGGKLYLEISDPDQTVAKALASGDLSSIPFEMRDFDTGEQRRVALRNVIKFGSYHEGVGGERGWWGKKHSPSKSARSRCCSSWPSVTPAQKLPPRSPK